MGKIMEEYFSEIDKERIRQFGNIITPPNWNFYTSNEDFKYIPWTLNIFFWFIEDEEDPYANERLGEVHGPVRIEPISLWADCSERAAAILEKYGDGYVSVAEIRFYPNSIIDLEGTLIHELAHLAVSRLNMRKQKPWKNNLPFCIERIEDDMHGPIFQKFWRVMINRAKKVFGEERVKDQWIHLRACEKWLYKKNNDDRKVGPG